MVNIGKSGKGMDYLKRYLIEEEIEEYQENHISRREMMRRVLIITGSVPMTASILLAAGCGASATPTTAPAVATTAPTTAAQATTAATRAATTAPAAATTSGAATTIATATRAASATVPAAATATRGGSPVASATRTASPAGGSNGVTISPTDPAIDAGAVQFPGQGGVALLGYLSSPKAATKAPGIIVIHENRGLTEHIKDMTRRYAKSGFVALAIDLISRQGGTEKIADPAQIPNILGQSADREALVQDMLSAVAFLKTQPKFAGPKAGVVGYCFGGGMTWLLATRSADIAAANPYYGPPPDPIANVQNIVGPVLAFYGETDARINANIPAIEAAMKQYNKTFEARIYPGAGHAFNNDTGQAFNAAAAQDAYQRSVAFFNANLKG
ncbi:MAG TPA: dienelactone hydrolase family protein [Thermomicrobiales bacterium]|jgi:carboxymethylenebutenolidase